MIVSAKKFEIDVLNSIFAEKQQLFRSIRGGYSENNNKKVQMISENSQTNSNCNTEAYMEKLLAEVKNSDGVRICNKILDEGIHNSLVKNLRKNIDVEISLQLICAILTKQKVKIANKFVRLGLLQQILRHTETRSNIDICMNILANIVFENVEYAEMMLQNKVHHQLFELFRKVIFSKQKLDKVDQQTGFTIMWALASLLQVQNTLPYKLPFIQILEFALEVFKKELYIGIIIEIIFLVGYSFREETQNLATWAISSILNQVSTQCRYIQNLLILIRLLSPIDIDYSKISTLAMTAEGKIISYCLKILQKIVNVYPNSIPRNFEWWERYYIKITRPQDIEYFTCLLTKSKIRLQFVYRVVHDILEKYCPSHLTISNEALICINSLLQGSQNPEQRKKTKFYLKSSNIIHQLQRLYESKNAQIHRKSEYLLTAINSNL